MTKILRRRHNHRCCSHHHRCCSCRKCYSYDVGRPAAVTWADCVRSTGIISVERASKAIVAVTCITLALQAWREPTRLLWL